LFETAYAGQLGLDLTHGDLKRFRTANDSFEAWHGFPVTKRNGEERAKQSAFGYQGSENGS